MEKENEKSSITYMKNLDKQNFSSTIIFPIDSKVNIKTILTINSYIYDEKIECANGKAVVNGKIGVKTIYIDTDNISNVLTESQPFSTTIIDNSITNDCFINLTNLLSTNEILTTEGNLKIECNTSFDPILYVNLGLKNNLNNVENTVCKNSKLLSEMIENKIDTSFNYTSNIETSNEISKILSTDSYFCFENATAQDNFAIIEGKLCVNVIYETIENDELKIKQITDRFNIKTDVEIENLTSDNKLDICLTLDKSNEEISSDIEDGNTIITINHKIKVTGVSIKNVEIDVIEDLYCTKNEIEISNSSREFICEHLENCFNESVFGEITLTKDETAIDEIISNTNIRTEITNSYIKNNIFCFEGIVNSTIIYIDELKEIKSKDLEIPFVIKTKYELEDLPIHHICLHAETDKIKARRGTIIEIEYNLTSCLHIYKTSSKNIVDTFSIGKSLDFSQYDYQIYVAKQNESTWELCKRIKCYPEDLIKCNSNLPNEFLGGEKIIIKR